jgi:hypothetical protein
MVKQDPVWAKQWLLYEIEATQWYAMSQSELKKIQVGRQRVIELMPSNDRKGGAWTKDTNQDSHDTNITPRYVIRLVDVSEKGPNGTLGVFIIPQGREHEYLFATDDGAMELASGAGFSRFLLVSLGRTHVFDSITAVQEELNPKIMELCPHGLAKGEKIPYLTVEEGLGTRTVVATGTSLLSGDYLIEDMDECRRLIFLSNTNTIQTEMPLAGLTNCRHPASVLASSDTGNYLYKYTYRYIPL